jgi:hypothetical protein
MDKIKGDVQQARPCDSLNPFQEDFELKLLHYVFLLQVIRKLYFLVAIVF